MVKLTKVVSDDLYDQINSYVESKKIIVEDYDGMVNTILRMTKDGYCFTMDRDILRDAMESLTYMYAPDDDMNKDRLTQQLVDDEEDDDSSEEGGEDFGNMDLMKMMQMMGGAPGCPPCTPPTGEATTQEEVVVKKEDASDSNADDNASEEKQCPVTGESCKEACSEGACAKEEELMPSEKTD
tara:strand:- start:1060 stop:1608 length:549 start_codon:yes stop_codon:yes gene_type:complete